MSLTASTTSGLLRTGVPGLDDVLIGGLDRHRLYLLEGTPGTGKTTLALQVLREGVANGMPGLYITLSETEQELRGVAESHGWSLDGIDVFQMITDEGLDPDADQTVLHPSELELGETTRAVIARVQATRPEIVVFDSLSELRLLAQNPLRYRRQVLAMKHFFTAIGCTVLLLDDRTSDRDDLQLHSIAHGVLTLEQIALDFGSERRRLRVLKMRAKQFRGGYHDYVIQPGGLLVFPRLIASEHHREFTDIKVSAGNPGLDGMLGGGLTPGTSLLLVGPAGAGKTTMATLAIVAALRRGERAAYFMFDEGLGTLLTRSTALGMDLRPFIGTGQLTVQQIDPAEMSPGEFAIRVRHAVEQHKAGTIAIDSLNGYLQSMPGERFLILQMHELLTYLNQSGVVTLLVLGQHGMVGDLRSSLDVSYLADAVVLLRFFEVDGVVRKAIAVLKTRSARHERSIREFRLDTGGLTVGKATRGFSGVLSGSPVWSGKPGDLLAGEVDYEDTVP